MCVTPVSPVAPANRLQNDLFQRERYQQSDALGYQGPVSVNAVQGDRYFGSVSPRNPAGIYGSSGRMYGASSAAVTSVRPGYRSAQSAQEAYQNSLEAAVDLGPRIPITDLFA